MFSICLPANSMLDIVFTLLLRLTPRTLRGIAVIWMDRFQPPETEAALEAHSGENNPLRAGPSSAAIRPTGGPRKRNDQADCGGSPATHPRGACRSGGESRPRYSQE